MPRPDYIPRPDGACRTWAASLAGHLSAEPARFGVSADLAAELAARADEFAAALSVSRAGGTRTRIAILTKDDARRRMTDLARRAARLAKAHAGVTPRDLATLGLSIDGHRPPVLAPPATGPHLMVTTAPNCRLVVRLVDLSRPSTLQKPRGTLGAGIWVRLGPRFAGADPPHPADMAAVQSLPYATGPDVPPRSTDECTLAALATRGRVTLTLPAAAGLRSAYVVARWFDTRGNPSPPGPIVRTAVMP
ncbi:MAG TPA: hypothetical protein VEA69_25695 [Tepidisphaeraceae bacterium]|nr:hypothetical protein [Tepidisphaeraceae bacterium]